MNSRPETDASNTSITSDEEEYSHKIFYAIEDEDYGSIALFSKDDFNVRDNETRMWPLHLAVNLGNKKIVELLLQKHAAVNAIDRRKRTALHIAARMGREDIGEILLSFKAKIDSKDSDDRTPAHFAAAAGYPQFLEFLSKAGANLDTQDSFKETPLFKAVEFKRKETVEYLTKKCKIDTENCKQQTALTLAASINEIAITQILLDAGANVFHCTEQKHTVLMFAASRNYVDLAKVIIESLKENKKLISKLINSENKFGDTALFFASWNGSVEMAKLLIKHKINVLHSNKQGLTALMHSCYHHHTEVTKLLLEANADANARDKLGNSVLFFATQFNKDSKLIRESLKLLFREKINLDTKNKHGETALMHACHLKNIEAVRLLLQQGCNIFYQDSNGNTALDYAQDNADIVKLLTSTIEKTTSAEQQYTNRSYESTITEDDSVIVEIQKPTILFSETIQTNEDNYKAKLLAAIKQNNRKEVQSMLKQPDFNLSCQEALIEAQIQDFRDIVLDIVQFQLDKKIIVLLDDHKETWIESSLSMTTNGVLSNGFKVDVKRMKSSRLVSSLDYYQIEHSNLVRVLNIIYPQPNAVTVITELHSIEYETLTSLLEDAEQANLVTIGRRKIKYIALQFFDALDFLDKNELFHGNLNADNFFLNNQNHLKLSEWGTVPQKTYYQAPELLSSSLLIGNIKSDMWSAGLLVLAMATASVHPDQDKTERRQMLKQSRCGKNIIRVVEWCLRKQRKRPRPLEILQMLQLTKTEEK